MMPRRLGVVIGGSLSKGLAVRLDAGVATEDIAVGHYVVIEGRQRRFFGMVSDVSLEATDPRLPANPPDIADPFVAAVIAGTATYGQLQVVPLLVVGDSGSLDPVRTVPPHFAAVYRAADPDMASVFGQPDASHIVIGTPLDMTAKVCLDVPQFVMRSNGVFGKSGTGKSFLNRVLLTAMIQAQRTTKAVALVFDMHSEYAFEVRSEAGRVAKGLKEMFPAEVAVFSLDPDSVRRRGLSPDFDVQIGYNDIEPDDIALLAETLSITDRGVDAAREMAEVFGDEWLETFLGQPVRETYDAIKERTEVALATLQGLRRSLGRLRSFDFMVPRASRSSVEAILGCVTATPPRHVVLEFGKYRRNDAAYVLVANLLTRRLHDRYVAMKERAYGNAAAEPNPLVIAIEEAHLFLNPRLAAQTTFGTIAREMRKYNVTLLVIDQRPSGLDEEVMSQLGTKLCFPLDNERDLDAVLSGVAGRSELRSVLSRLESRQQALIFGHALPLPVVVVVRDPTAADFLAETARHRPSAQDAMRDLYGG